MMKFLHTVFLLCFFVISYGQIRFEQGYIIDNNNQRKEVLIKNVDWLNNPKSFEYKEDENSKIDIGSIDNVKEFGITNISRYVKADVKIDRSSEEFGKISITEQPNFVDEKLFLKVLIEGNATLFEYKDYNLVRYFFNGSFNEEVNPVQLVYKKYEVSNNQYSYNRTYRGQIAENFKCSSITNDKLRKLEYKKKDLLNLFVQINECLDPNFTKINSLKNDKVEFNLWLRPRLNSSKLTLDSNLTGTIDYKNKSSFSFGLETEFVLPFNKRKWSIIVEPTYQSYKSEDVSIKYGPGENFSSVNYKNIELPFGFRHYFFLDSKSKIFMNAQYMISFDLDSKLTLTSGQYNRVDLDISNRGNLALGIGYNYNDKLSAEFRFNTNRKVVDYVYWNSSFRTFSFVIGYNIF